MTWKRTVFVGDKWAISLTLGFLTCQGAGEVEKSKGEQKAPCINHNWTETPPLLSTRDCISIATHCRAPGNNLPSSWPFFWFHGLRNSKGWLFQRRKKRLLEVLYKGRLMPFKWTITNGADMLLSKMNEVSLEGQSSSNTSASEPCCNLYRQLGLRGSFIIKDILERTLLFNTHME